MLSTIGSYDKIYFKKKVVTKLMMNINRKWRWFILKISLLGIVSIIITSCFKEEFTSIPEIVSFQISPDSLIAGDTAILNIMAVDADGDSLFYRWLPGDGTYLTDNKKQKVIWKAPYKEGIISNKVEISDGKVIKYKSVSVNVSGFFYDKFDNRQLLWKETNCDASYTSGRAFVKKEALSKDGIYYIDLPNNIEPPYAVHMKMGLGEKSGPLSYKDKYGLYLNFKNIAADTVVKALWFRIYPASILKNWNISVSKDMGTTSSWVNLNNQSQGISNKVRTNYGGENLIKLEIDSNYTLSIFLNDELLFTSSSLQSNYLSNSKPPKLILEQIGARTSNADIFIDNTFITKKTDKKTADIF